MHYFKSTDSSINNIKNFCFIIYFKSFPGYFFGFEFFEWQFCCSFKLSNLMINKKEINADGMWTFDMKLTDLGLCYGWSVGFWPTCCELSLFVAGCYYIFARNYTSQTRLRLVMLLTSNVGSLCQKFVSRYKRLLANLIIRIDTT